MRAVILDRMAACSCPRTLITALEELTAQYERARVDPNFQRELDTLLHDFAGPPNASLLRRASGRKTRRRENLFETGSGLPASINRRYDLAALSC